MSVHSSPNMVFLAEVEFVVLVLFGLVVLAVLVFYGVMIRSLFRDAPFVPSPRRVAEAMMDLAAVRPDEVVVDLGSGWGDILVAAARRDAQARGYEQSFILSVLTRLRGKVRVVRDDLFHADLRDVDVVTCYLYPRAMERLTSKFESELKPGARVVSALFPIHGWTPAQVIHIANRPIFLYHYPQKITPT